MKYLLLAYGDRKKIEALTPAEMEALMTRIKAHDEELKRSGHHVWGESLEWDVMTVRSRGGKVVTTDGPFVETKETVGGLVMIEARDLNEALRVAALHPASHMGEELGCAIEVRPVAAGCHQ